MYLAMDRCEKCVNRNGCTYKKDYDSGTAVIEEVLERYKEVADWYGCLRATCDYFVKDTSTEQGDCCPGG